MKKLALIYLSLLIVAIGISCYLVFHDLDSVYIIPEQKETVENDIYLIDLNAADASELERIPGIGYKLASKIVEYREEHGPFKDYNDLMNVDGIGRDKLMVIMEYVRIK